MCLRPNDRYIVLPYWNALSQIRGDIRIQVYIRQTYFNDKMVSKDIILVKDLMKNETCFNTHREICRQYDCDITLMQYNSMEKKIKDSFHDTIISNDYNL